MTHLSATAARYTIAITLAMVTGVSLVAISNQNSASRASARPKKIASRATRDAAPVSRQTDTGDSALVDYQSAVSESRLSRYPRAPIDRAREMVNASVDKSSPPPARPKPAPAPAVAPPVNVAPEPPSAAPKVVDAPKPEVRAAIVPRVAAFPRTPPTKAPVQKEVPAYVAQADKLPPLDNTSEEPSDAPRPADPEPVEDTPPPAIEPIERKSPSEPSLKETLPRPPAVPSRNRRLPAAPSGLPPLPSANPSFGLGNENAGAPGMSSPLLPSQPGFLPGQPSAIGALPIAPGEASASSTPVWADKPKLGDHWPTCDPTVDCAANLIETQEGDFSNDPFIDAPYDECEQGLPYYGKRPVPRAQPFWLFGRSFYDYGPYAPAPTFFGRSNLLLPQFMGFGDVRVGMASNRNTVNDFNVAATTINLDMDLRLTSTERLHAFATPLARNGSFTRYNFGNNDNGFTGEGNFNLLAGYFEGDAGAIVGGMTNYVLPFDLPFAVGAMPLVFQNGVWMEDIVTGAAVTIPARNSPLLKISNMDVTFFTAWDGVSSPAVQFNNSAASIYGVGSWVEAWGGYLELDYAFLDDRATLDRSYHNLGVGWTRRYGKWLSNSVRWIGNIGQDPTGIDRTAHGSIVLIENSLITQEPSNWVPYFNLWGGFGRPQSLARAATAGGILRNTGILFESDNLTGYPTLDPSGQNTYGAALGINILKLDFSQQLVLETAVLQTMGGVNSRLAQGQEYGLGIRYQRNLTNASLIRLDGMYGFLPDGPRDIAGSRVEWRMKF